MSFPVIWLPFLVAHTAALVAEPVPAEPVPAEPVPLKSAPLKSAPQFASAVRTLAEAGYELRDLQTRPTRHGIEIGMVLASQSRAKSLSVRFDEQTQDFSAFEQQAIAMPQEERHYVHGAELLEELSLSAPLAVAYDCADFYLDFGSRSVSLAEHAFEVELRHTRKRPGAALSSWLGELLEEGELIDLRDERFDDGANLSSEVIFVIDNSEGVQELRVAVDTDGHPLELSLVHTPSVEVYKRYDKSNELRQALGRSVESLQFVFGDEGDPADFDAVELQIRLRSKGTARAPADLRIALDAFEDAPLEDCGC